MGVEGVVGGVEGVVIAEAALGEDTRDPPETDVGILMGILGDPIFPLPVLRLCPTSKVRV